MEHGSIEIFHKNSEIKINSDLSNTEAIGNVLYTEYLHYFQISGLILLVAMIGAILLTYEEKIILKDKILQPKFREKDLKVFN